MAPTADPLVQGLDANLARPHASPDPTVARAWHQRFHNCPDPDVRDDRLIAGAPDLSGFGDLSLRHPYDRRRCLDGRNIQPVCAHRTAGRIRHLHRAWVAQSPVTGAPLASEGDLADAGALDIAVAGGLGSAVGALLAASPLAQDAPSPNSDASFGYQLSPAKSSHSSSRYKSVIVI